MASFSLKPEHAAQWGDLLNGAGNSKILEVQIPKLQADSFLRWDRLDGIGPARYGELDQLGGASIKAFGQ